MENPALLNIKQRSSKSRSRSRTPMQKFFSSAEDMDVPAMNTRSSSRNLYIITDEDDAHHTYVTSDYSSEDGNISPTTVQNIDNTEKENKRNGHKEERQRTEAELLAYKEYKEAGEYWNKYPKTDYTYSKRSPHRRELPGGSVALPNMSRPSLHSFDERMDKKFLAERINYYESSKIKKSTYSTSAGSSSDGMRLRNSMTKTTSYKDTEFSDDEMPSQSYYYNGRDVTDVMVEQEGLVRRFWSKLVSVGRWTKSWFVDVEESHVYRTPIRRRNAERGFFSRCYSKTQNGVLWFFSQIYWLITLVSLFDCKLLCGRETPPRSRKRGLVLLLLLPLLLLCGVLLYLQSPVQLSEYYPFEHPISYYPDIMYDKVLDSVEYTKMIAHDGANELSDYWTKVKEYSNDALDNMWSKEDDLPIYSA
ncbi:uncharacterized protein LOC113372139 [Ctenocephalides felis]|uniref:uncharacterized protein LOC113372139 n=1 Tax=Ctenocephalides felis TaxID=7515 RepID=UPI000E6E51A4|nr:uncharacterized protein LOC113372139 [Ctenocephalides felis]XP_026468246.1 uncharacterized protein LOC113372139 [Ctenocephalides felis]